MCQRRTTLIRCVYFQVVDSVEERINKMENYIKCMWCNLGLTGAHRHKKITLTIVRSRFYYNIMFVVSGALA